MDHNGDKDAAFAFPLESGILRAFRMTESLSDVLRQMRMESLVQQTEFIRDCLHAECYGFEERTEEARKLIHAVLYPIGWICEGPGKYR